MEPAPLSDDDLEEVSAEHGRPPIPPATDYLGTEIPFANDVELVEVTDEAAPLPALELDQSDSVPALRPLHAARSGVKLSRARLVVMGALAFSAGILTSAGARTLVKSPRTSGAPLATPPALTIGADHDIAPAAVAAPTPPASPTVIEPSAAPQVEAKNETAEGNEKDEMKVAAPPTTAERPRDRAVTTRTRGSRHPQRRAQATSAARTEAGAESSRSDTDAPAAAPPARDPATWVDPFAQ